MGADEKLWGIKSIVVELPSHKKINIDMKKIEENSIKNPDLVPSMQYYYQRINERLATFTMDEMEEYGKQKTNYMYKKYSNQRILYVIIIFILAGAIFVRMSMNKVSKLTGSTLAILAENKFRNHREILNLLQKMKRREFKWDRNIAGEMRSNHFNGTVGVEGLIMGKVRMEGKYLEDKNHYQFSRFELTYFDQNKMEVISLL